MGESQLDTLETERLPKKPRVLIVEDDEGLGQFLRASLEYYEELEIEGPYKLAGETIKMLEQRKPDDPPIDILITDLGLLDGQDAGALVAQAFRKKYPTSSIVFLTGEQDRIDKLYSPEQKRELNFEVWAKPLNINKLTGKVNKVKDSINTPPVNP